MKKKERLTKVIPSLQRDRARKKLNELLSLADDAEFCQLIWATDAIQSGRLKPNQEFKNFPIEAINCSPDSPYRMHAWTAETLINELLVVPKAKLPSLYPTRKLNCFSFISLAAAINYINKIENAEVGIFTDSQNVIFELHRIAQRQFHLQRGFFNLPHLYRYAYLYNFSKSNDIFYKYNNISISDFIYCGFAFYKFFMHNSFMQDITDFSNIGINGQMRDATLALMSKSHEDMRLKGVEIRKINQQIAYKASVLRETPCIKFIEKQGRIYSPLIQLIIQRVTSGIYYDLVEHSSVRNDIAYKFENYCREIIEAYLKDIKVIGEITYSKQNKKSTDFLISKDNKISIIGECKATKMNFQAKFSDDPFKSASQGYDEIVKAVVQIWRLCSDFRRGLLGYELEMNHDVCGLILTLDSWLEMAVEIRGEVIEKARRHCVERESQIEPCDMKAIVFCHIDDLEQTLSRSSSKGFFETIKAATTKRYSGYHLASVQNEIGAISETQKPYPFKDKIGDVLPWWDDLRRRRVERTL